jgi:hypothetical protein
MSNAALFAPPERRPSRRAIVGFRANEAERRALRELARERGVSVTAFVRAALAERVRRLHGDVETVCGTE